MQRYTLFLCGARIAFARLNQAHTIDPCGRASHSRRREVTMMNAALLLAVLFLQPPQNAQPPNPAPAADAETAPTVADVRKALENNDGTEALRLVSQLLSLRGKAAQGLDRYELFMLKAEGHLCQRAGDAAAQSFKQAAEQTNNREQAAMARASEQLIRRSRRLAYTPKRVVKGQVAKRDPIDIVDPEKR